ncbi:MAG: molecular chaperone Hsp33 [Rhodospirillaceae bacterium]|jgi:molecular chaperone Hsp33|nr:molecular chaperone Hsp33 [Rhodospirillaceae bacterium]
MAVAGPDGLDAPVDDVLQPFQIEGCAVRGRLARLGPLADEVLGKHGYPAPVSALVGECLALTAVLAGALKFEGIFTLQMVGDGPLRTLVTDMTSEGNLRAYAGFDEARVAELAEAPDALAAPVSALFGKGHLAFTVDQGPETERYQAITALEGATVSEMAGHFFRQSEQIDASFYIAAERRGLNGHGAWRAAALMIQRVPLEGGRDRSAPQSMATPGEDSVEVWNRARILAASVTDDELTDPALMPDRLLYRLFHEDGVRVYPPQALAARCRCSRERVERTLRGLTREGLEEFKVGGEVVMKCEFCTAEYRYDEPALAMLFSEDQA